MKLSTITFYILVIGLMMLPYNLIAESAPSYKNQDLNTHSLFFKNQKNERAIDKAQKRLKLKQERLEKRLIKKEKDDRKMDKRAIVAFICGLLGFILPFAICAIVFGRIAIRNIKKNPKTRGMVFAQIGWILGLLGCAFFVAFVLSGGINA